MGKVETYGGCLGFIVSIGLLTGFLAKFMNGMLAFLISFLVLSFIFVFWFGWCYNRRLNDSRIERLDDYSDDE
jgi:hypothetical protein